MGEIPIGFFAAEAKRQEPYALSLGGRQLSFCPLPLQALSPSVKVKVVIYPGLSLQAQVLSPGRETRSVLHDNNQKVPEATLGLLSAPHLAMPLGFLLQTPI